MVISLVVSAGIFGVLSGSGAGSFLVLVMYGILSKTFLLLLRM